MEQKINKKIVDIRKKREYVLNSSDGKIQKIKTIEFCIRENYQKNKEDFVLYVDPKFYWVSNLEQIFQKNEIILHLRDLARNLEYKMSIKPMKEYYRKKKKLVDELMIDFQQNSILVEEQEIKQIINEAPQKKFQTHQTLSLQQNIPKRIEQLIFIIEQKCMKDEKKFSQYLDDFLMDVNRIEKTILHT